MKKILFMCFFALLVQYNCLGQILSLQVNATGGKYFYLTRDIYDQFFQVTYSGGWTGALETNLVVNKLGFSWLTLDVSAGLKNCYRHETIRGYGHIPPTGVIAYTLTEGNYTWNFLEVRILPEVKIFKKQNFYLFGGYYQGLLYRHKAASINKTQFGTGFPENVVGGQYGEQILKGKELNEGSYRNKVHGFSVGLRYVWRNFTFQVRDDYAKSSSNIPILYLSPILFNSHTVCIGLGYEFDFFDKK